MALWTDDELAIAKQMRMLRHSHEAIAERLGRTTGAVRQKLTGGGSRKLERTCSDCNSSIHDANKSGLCRLCCDTLRRPDVEAKRVAALRAKMDTDPIYRRRAQERMRRVGIEAGKDPMLTAARSERGKWLYANKLDTDEVREKIKATRPAVGAELRRQRLSWMPEAYWGEYLFLIRRKRIKKAQAKAIILAQIASDKAKASRVSPFERQQRALDNGAKLVANDRQPMFGEVLREAAQG